MKSYLLISALVLAFTAQSQAREFYYTKMNISLSYTSLANGTEPLTIIKDIDVRVSDDALFCQASVSGQNYPCKYVNNQNFVGNCISRIQPTPSNKDGHYYNCIAGQGIFLTVGTIIQIMTVNQLPEPYLSNLTRKLHTFAKMGKSQEYLDRFVGLDRKSVV